MGAFGSEVKDVVPWVKILVFGTVREEAFLGDLGGLKWGILMHFLSIYFANFKALIFKSVRK